MVKRLSCNCAKLLLFCKINWGLNPIGVMCAKAENLIAKCDNHTVLVLIYCFMLHVIIKGLQIIKIYLNAIGRITKILLVYELLPRNSWSSLETVYALLIHENIMLIRSYESFPKFIRSAASYSTYKFVLAQATYGISESSPLGCRSFFNCSLCHEARGTWESACSKCTWVMS